MQLEYTNGGDSYSADVLSGTSSWSFDNGDGTLTRVKVDAPHPLDAAGHLVEINKAEDLAVLKVCFSFAPDSYTVRCWADSYIGDIRAYEDNYTIVGIVDDTIQLHKDGQGFIYEVHAIWQQGNAYYAFHITTV